MATRPAVACGVVPLYPKRFLGNFFSLPNLLRGSGVLGSLALGCSLCDPAVFFLLPSMLVLSRVFATLLSRQLCFPRVQQRRYKSLRPVLGCQIKQNTPESALWSLLGRTNSQSNISQQKESAVWNNICNLQLFSDALNTELLTTNCKLIRIA